MKNLIVLSMWKAYAKRLEEGGATAAAIASKLTKNNKHRQVFRAYGPEIRCGGVLIHTMTPKVTEATPEASMTPLEIASEVSQ